MPKSIATNADPSKVVFSQVGSVISANLGEAAVAMHQLIRRVAGEANGARAESRRIVTLRQDVRAADGSLREALAANLKAALAAKQAPETELGVLRQGIFAWLDSRETSPPPDTRSKWQLIVTFSLLTECCTRSLEIPAPLRAWKARTTDAESRHRLLLAAQAHTVQWNRLLKRVASTVKAIEARAPAHRVTDLLKELSGLQQLHYALLLLLAEITEPGSHLDALGWISVLDIAKVAASELVIRWPAGAATTEVLAARERIGPALILSLADLAAGCSSRADHANSIRQAANLLLEYTSKFGGWVDIPLPRVPASAMPPVQRSAGPDWRTVKWITGAIRASSREGSVPLNSAELQRAADQGLILRKPTQRLKHPTYCVVSICGCEKFSIWRGQLETAVRTNWHPRQARSD